jgi:hypothetical protein
MKANELANQIRRLVGLHGDHDVMMYCYGCGGHYNCEPYTGVDEVVMHTETVGQRRVIRIEGEY